MNCFFKNKLSTLMGIGIFFISGLAFAYTNIAVNPDGTPMKFQNFSASSPLVWNPESGPLQDTSSIHTFQYGFAQPDGNFLNYSYVDTAAYNSYCASSGGGSGGCSLNPLLSEVWAASPVTNQEGIDLVNSALDVWSTQATDASLSYSQGSSLGVDVNVCNYPQYIDSVVPDFAINGDENDPRVCGCLGTCSSACNNPVVFDANGDIIAMEAGEGNRYAVIGSAGPVVWPGVDHFLKFEAIINGVCADASPDSGCGGTTFATSQMLAAMVHELGHAQGLGHSQVNPKAIDFTGGSSTSPGGSAYLDTTSPSGIAGAVPTMYPFLVSGDDQGSLMMDDKIGIAHLYPAASYSSNYCTVSGVIYRGTSGLRCVEVVFRDSTSATTQVLNAVSVLSGGEAANNSASFTNVVNPGTNSCTASGVDACGAYSVRLPAGKSYVIEVNGIPNFGSGSSIGPCSTNPSFSTANQSTGWLIQASSGSVTSCPAGGAGVSTPVGATYITVPSS